MKNNKIFRVYVPLLLVVCAIVVTSFFVTVRHCEFTYEVVPCKMDSIIPTTDTIVIAKQLPYYELSDVCFHNETFFEYVFLR